MGTFLMVIVMAVLVNNFVVVQFLGICPFLGLSKKTSSSIGMGIAVTLVMTITCLVTYPIYTYLLVPFELEYLEIIVFIFVIAALVQMIEKFIKKFSPSLYKAMGIIDQGQMLATLGITSMNIGVAVLYGFFAGVGFTVAIVLLSGLRTKVDHLDIPNSFKGFPITMITASFIAMAFYVFNLI